MPFTGVITGTVADTGTDYTVEGDAPTTKPAHKRLPASHKIVSRGKDGAVYRFFCELSGMTVYTSPPVTSETSEGELMLAWNAAKPYFNFCPRCGRNVSDVMFNCDKSECVDCSPWLCLPVYCTSCGGRIGNGDLYCRRCGEAVERTGADGDAGCIGSTDEGDDNDAKR